MSKRLRVPYTCPKCNSTFPSKHYSTDASCVVCLYEHILDKLRYLPQTTLEEQYALLTLINTNLEFLILRLTRDRRDIADVLDKLR